MAPPKLNGKYDDNNDGIWGIHETRIQRLETDLSERNVLLETVKTDLSHLVSSVGIGLETLNSKMDKASLQNESIEAKVESLNPRIEKLEHERSKRISRKNSIRKAAMGILLTAAGAGAAKIGTVLVPYLSFLWGG